MSDRPVDLLIEDILESIGKIENYTSRIRNRVAENNRSAQPYYSRIFWGRPGDRLANHQTGFA